MIALMDEPAQDDTLTPPSEPRSSSSESAKGGSKRPQETSGEKAPSPGRLTAPALSRERGRGLVRAEVSP
jgi:hypothetical protein